MSINLKKYYIEIVMKNMDFKEVIIKLPITDESLEKALLKILQIEKDMLGYKNFDTELMSVLDIIKVDNIEIKKPTNIYYLNLYLNILKDKDINLSSEKMIITTDILKEKITDLLKIQNKDMNFEEIKNFIKENNKLDNPKEETKEINEVIKNQKTMFTVKQLQKIHNERKGK